MKVIFRSNNRFAKKTLGQLGGAEEWLQSLEKYLSEDAIARLSLFVESNDVSLATLDVVDGDLHVHSSVKDKNKLTAIESVIGKCAIQLKKHKVDYTNETIRYNNDYNVLFDTLQSDIEVDPVIMDCFELMDVEQRLEAEKQTEKYNRIMNKYISYLYRKNDIRRAEDHLRILYSIYDNVDLEEISVAEYERLAQSIVQIEKEINAMINKQYHFESNTKDKLYVDHIIEEEIELAKLKK